MASEAQAVATYPMFRAIVVHLDVTIEESVSQAIAYMLDSFKRIDYCVHCAAVCPRLFPFPLVFKFAELNLL